MAGRFAHAAHELLTAVAVGALATTIVLGSAFVWIGVPVGGLWLAGRITTDPEHFLLFALCSIPTSMVLFGWLLYRVNRVYEGLRIGARVEYVGTRSAWLSSSSDAHRRDRQKRAPRALIDVAMIGSAWAAIALMAIWFFFFAELRLVTW